MGRRHYEEDGTLVFETPLKNGKKHGIEYGWYDSGQLHSAEPFVEGVMHGTTRQWTPDGRLMGTYTMVHGTGLDVWRNESCDGRVYVSEIWEYRNSKPHGFTWWLDEDQSVCFERHFQEGYKHGVERWWNGQGRICRGYPKYFVRGEQVTKRQYLKAAAADPTLPPFRIEDNLPVRDFPDRIRRKAGLPRRGS